MIKQRKSDHGLVYQAEQLARQDVRRAERDRDPGEDWRADILFDDPDDMEWEPAAPPPPVRKYHLVEPSNYRAAVRDRRRLDRELLAEEQGREAA